MDLTVAVVGLGVMGRNHVRILSQLPGVRLIGVTDTDRTARDGAASYGCPVLADTAAVAEARPDLIVVAVPTSAHRKVAEELLRPGVSLLIEKPLAGSPEDGEAILAAARRVGARIGVGHVERFNPIVVALKELMDGDHLGAPYAFSARRLGPFPPRVGDVGVVIDLATHDLDAITHLHPSPIVRVQAELYTPHGSAHEHMASCIFRFDDDVIATLEANWTSPSKVRDLTVIGERGMFLGRYLSQELTFVRRSSGRSAITTGEVQYLVERESVEIAVARAEPLRRELEAVADAVRKDRDLPIPGEDGLRVLTLAQSILEAGAHGKPLGVPA